MSRDATEQENKWIKSMARLLNSQPKGTSVFVDGGGLHLYDTDEYNAYAATGNCLGGLEPLGIANFGPAFDCGGF
jgi:hypothetical protein